MTSSSNFLHRNNAHVCWVPWTCRFRVLGSLQFFLEHGLFQISLILWLCLCATCNQTQKGDFQGALSRNCVHSHAIKTYFHWKSFALSLVLKVRVLENSLLMLWWKVFPQCLQYFISYLFIKYCTFDYIQYVHKY